MSRDASINLPWADGRYHFRLGWGELETLQEECDAGPFSILSRLREGNWRMADVSSTIRLGLIGGGMLPNEALRMVEAYVQKRPPCEHLMEAQAILSAGIVGAPEEDAGNVAAESPGSV